MKHTLPTRSAGIKPILQELKSDLKRVYGEHFLDMLLFGSYARGDFNEQSDVDVLLVFENGFETEKNTYRSIEIAYEYLLKDNAFISPILTTKTELNNASTSFFRIILNDGIWI